MGLYVGFSSCVAILIIFLNTRLSCSESGVLCPSQHICLDQHRRECVLPSLGCGPCLDRFREVDGRCEATFADEDTLYRESVNGQKDDDKTSVRRVERAADTTRSTTRTPKLETSASSPSSSKSSFNAMLVIALSVAAAVCFILGIAVACLCLRTMRSTLKETNVAEYPFGLPERIPASSKLMYSSEEQAQLFNYQQKKAQLKSHSRAMQQGSPLTSAGSGEELSTAGEEDGDGRDLRPGESRETLYVSSGQSQVKLGKIINPAFHSEQRSPGRRKPRVGSSGYSSSPSATTPPPSTSVRTPPIHRGTYQPVPTEES